MARNHGQGQGSHGEPGRKLRQDEQDGQDAGMEDQELKNGASESVPYIRMKVCVSRLSRSSLAGRGVQRL